MRRMIFMAVFSVIVAFIYGMQMSSIVLMILLTLAIFQIIGIVLLWRDYANKAGKVIYFIGIIGFVPIGLLGVFGMRSYIKNMEDEDSLSEDNFEKLIK